MKQIILKWVSLFFRSGLDSFLLSELLLVFNGFYVIINHYFWSITIYLLLLISLIISSICCHFYKKHSIYFVKAFYCYIILFGILGTHVLLIITKPNDFIYLQIIVILIVTIFSFYTFYCFLSGMSEMIERHGESKLAKLTKNRFIIQVIPSLFVIIIFIISYQVKFNFTLVLSFIYMLFFQLFIVIIFNKVHNIFEINKN